MHRSPACDLLEDRPGRKSKPGCVTILEVETSIMTLKKKKDIKVSFSMNTLKLFSSRSGSSLLPVGCPNLKLLLPKPACFVASFLFLKPLGKLRRRIKIVWTASWSLPYRPTT